MAIHFATFSAVAVTLAQDLFEITAPTASPVEIREITIGQYSDFADAQAELISIQLIRGYTVSGSGGSTLTPATRTGFTSATAAASVVKANNTTVANTGTASILVADSFNVAAGWVYRPLRREGIVIRPGIRLVCRITAPVDAITMNGTIVFDELGIDNHKPV